MPVVFSGLFLDTIQVDDPLGIPTIGVAAARLRAFRVRFVVYLAIETTIGLSVSAEEGLSGLHITEHGMEACLCFHWEAGRDAYPTGKVDPAVTEELRREETPVDSSR